MTGKMSYQEMKAKKKPNTRTVPICMDPELGMAFSNLSAKKEKLEELLEGLPGDRALAAELKIVEKKLKELDGEIQDAMYDFKFRAVNSTLIDEILSENQPTPKQLKEAAQKGEDAPMWNPDTMPPAIVAASLQDPELTLEEVQEMWEDENWNAAELLTLFEAAMTVNNTRVNVDLKKG